MTTNSTLPISVTGAMVYFTKFAVSKGLEVKLIDDDTIQLISLDKDVAFTIELQGSNIRLSRGAINSIRGKNITTVKVDFLNIVTCSKVTDAIEEVMLTWEVAPAKFYFNAFSEFIRSVTSGYDNISIEEDKIKLTSATNEFEDLTINIFDDNNLNIVYYNTDDKQIELLIKTNKIDYGELDQYRNFVDVYVNKVLGR